MSNINGNSNPHNKKLFTATTAAKAVQLSSQTIRRLGYTGKIKTFRLGRSVRFDLDEIIAVMQAEGRLNFH